MSIAALGDGWYLRAKAALRARWRLLPALALMPTLASCAVSFAGPSLLPDDDTTASIDKPAVLSKALDDEDLRRADAAMGAALDPGSNGTAVAWDNPQTASHGSFTPVAAAYPRAKLTCRAFLADLTEGSGHEKSLQGTACRLAEGRWFVRDIKPWKTSGA